MGKGDSHYLGEVLYKKRVLLPPQVLVIFEGYCFRLNLHPLNADLRLNIAKNALKFLCRRCFLLTMLCKFIINE